MEKVHSTPFHNYIQRNGFVMVSNLLLDHQQELGINEKELAFIIKIMKNRPGYATKDVDLDPSVCSKTLSRRRNSLKQKGLLNFSIIRKQDSNGCFSTIGISYDLSPLEIKLQRISDEIEFDRQKTIKEEIKFEEIVVEESDNSSLNKYLSDWEEHYGKKYKISKTELDYYNNLSQEEQKCVGKIFDYFNDKGLFDNGYTPRLSFFFNIKWRFAELKEYSSDSEEYNEFDEDYEEMLREIENETIKGLAEEKFYERYDNIKQNYPFYRAVERLVGRFYKNGELPDIQILIDHAYKDNLKHEKR